MGQCPLSGPLAICDCWQPEFALCIHCITLPDRSGSVVQQTHSTNSGCQQSQIAGGPLIGHWPISAVATVLCKEIGPIPWFVGHSNVIPLWPEKSFHWLTLAEFFFLVLILSSRRGAAPLTKFMTPPNFF